MHTTHFNIFTLYFFKERIILPLIGTMPSNPSQQENGRIFYGKYEGDNPMNLIFLVLSGGNIQVKKVNGNIEEVS